MGVAAVIVFAVLHSRRNSEAGHLNSGLGAHAQRTVPTAPVADERNQGRGADRCRCHFSEKRTPKAAKERPLRRWDPGAEWLGHFGPMMSGLCATAIACAVPLVFGIDGGWRWAFGIAGVLSVIGVVGAYLNFISESGATASGQSAARQH